MSIQFSQSIEAAKEVAHFIPLTACVSMGRYATAQGELVWQKGEIACVRANSAMYVGKRI